MDCAQPLRAKNSRWSYSTRTSRFERRISKVDLNSFTSPSSFKKLHQDPWSQQRDQLRPNNVDFRSSLESLHVTTDVDVIPGIMLPIHLPLPSLTSITLLGYGITTLTNLKTLITSAPHLQHLALWHSPQPHLETLLPSLPTTLISIRVYEPHHNEKGLETSILGILRIIGRLVALKTLFVHLPMGEQVLPD